MSPFACYPPQGVDVDVAFTAMRRDMAVSAANLLVMAAQRSSNRTQVSAVSLPPAARLEAS